MVFLPANSTHLTQPLDVAFYRPLKGAWREILLKWKKGPGCRETTIPRSAFPSLLNKLMDSIADKAKDNIFSWFRKTGIIPLNPEEVLRMLPEVEDQNSGELMNSSLIELLREMRYGGTNQFDKERRN